MDVFNELISGYILIKKKILARDLLLKNSEFKIFLKKSRTVYRAPEVQKGDIYVKIIFDNATDIDLGEDYIEYFKGLKFKYRDELKGLLTIRVICYGTFLSKIDLNNSNDSILVY